MDKKLTLSLDATVIDSAKSYAKSRKTSLSKMIENYLSLITSTAAVEPENGEVEVTPLVKSLIGVASVPDDYDFRADYADYLIEKYK
jgi:hypothetical protein